MLGEDAELQASRIIENLTSRTPWAEWRAENRAALIGALLPPDGNPQEKDVAEALSRKLFGRRIALIEAAQGLDDRFVDLRRRLYGAAPFGAGTSIGHQIELDELCRTAVTL